MMSVGGRSRSTVRRLTRAHGRAIVRTRVQNLVFSISLALAIVSPVHAMASAPSVAREIALTFDDSPRKTGTLMTGMERARRITDALKTVRAGPVAFFCNSPTRAPDGPERLKFFSDQGHLIANHGANHLDLYAAPVTEFTRDIEAAETELRDLPNFRRWFRFPFLHEGRTSADVEAVRSHLARTGYRNGYVTVDTQDWYMDELLRRAVAGGKKINQSRLCGTYKKMLADDAHFFDKMSVRALGRSVKHVILLHETDLNALCLSDVVRHLRAMGWRIISPDEAYQDPIARRDPSASVTLNQGRVYALAKERGYRGPYRSPWLEEAEIEREFTKRHVWSD